MQSGDDVVLALINGYGSSIEAGKEHLCDEEERKSMLR